MTKFIKLAHLNPKKYEKYSKFEEEEEKHFTEKPINRPIEWNTNVGIIDRNLYKIH